MTGSPYVRFGRRRSAWALTMNRSDSGASNDLGNGEMTGARIAMNAKERTMASPARPSGRPRKTPMDRRIPRQSRGRIVTARTRVEAGGVSEAHTRVEHSVQDVRDDVAENHEHGDDPEDGAREELVLVEDGPEEVVAHPEVGEDPLQDDRAADREGEADREGGHDGEVRVPGRVPPADRTLGEPFRLRGQDEVLPHHLEHRRLHEEDRARGADQDEGEGGKERVEDQVPRLKEEARGVPQPGVVFRGPEGVAPAPQGKRVPMEGEQPEEDEPDPEGGHVVEEEARDDGCGLADPAPTPGDERPEDDADRVLDDHGPAEQEEGPREGRGHDARDGLPLDERLAEVEGEHVPDELAHPDEVWIVDPERLVELLEARAVEVGVRPEPVDGRAGHRVEEDEDDDRDDEEGDDPLDHALPDVPSQRGHESHSPRSVSIRGAV